MNHKQLMDLRVTLPIAEPHRGQHVRHQGRGPRASSAAPLAVSVDRQQPQQPGAQHETAALVPQKMPPAAATHLNPGLRQD